MYMKAGMMAREYGKMPTEVLGISDMPRGRRFHLDFDIYKATSDRLHEAREEMKEQQDPTTSRVASNHQRKQMVKGKESRAKQRESMEQAGMNAPSPDGQLSQLDEIMEERQEAKQMQEQVNNDG